MEGYLDAEQLKSMKREELQDLAKKLNVSAGGKNEEIIARITAVEIDVPKEDKPTEAADHTVATSQQGEISVVGMVQPKEEQERTMEAGVPEAAGAAEMVTVQVVAIFRDKQSDGQIRAVGEVYKVNHKRAEELMAAGVAEIRR